ncbi:MAG: PA14 domain-containing protein [Candidatus Sumerlaeota bacterium]|nr:PA14 domain-containing protein [Candidatus Sumerlaeota bacterium]
MKKLSGVLMIGLAAAMLSLANAAYAELSYDYYAGDNDTLPDFDKATPGKTGTIDSFDITLGGKADEHQFAIRFKGGIKIEKEGLYTFYTNSDDGSKLWIDDKVVVDNDGLHAAEEKSGKVRLAAGAHKIVVGYFEKDGDKVLEVSFEGPDIAKKALPKEILSAKAPDALPPPPAAGGNLNFEYFEGSWDNLPDFGTLTAAKKGLCDGFDITIGGKAAEDNFGIRFTGQIKIEKEGEYTFYTNSDDGSKLLIDDKVVVDNDGLHGAEEKEGKVTLTAASHKIAVLFFEKDGEQVLDVQFAGPGIDKKKIPDSILTAK